MFDVPTKSLNLSVKRNSNRFPQDFMFRLTNEEWDSLRFQIETLEKGKGRHTKYLPYAFTEHGVTMLGNILRSERAVNMSIAIVRAFIALRQMALQYKELAEQLAKLEKETKKQFKDIYAALNYLLQTKQKEEVFSKRERIGFKKGN